MWTSAKRPSSRKSGSRFPTSGHSRLASPMDSTTTKKVSYGSQLKKASEPKQHPSFAEALRFWVKLGFISFGGPTGQIAIMHTELVEKKKWISDSRFLHALNYCML